MQIVGGSSTLCRSWVGWLGLLGLITVWSCAPGSSRAQDQVVFSDWKRGFQGLNILAQGNEMKVLERSDWLQTPMDRRAVIVLGEMDSLPVNLMLLSNQGVPIFIGSEAKDELTLLSFGIRIDDRASRPYRDSDFFRFQDCPLIRPLRNRMGQVHPLFDRVSYLLTNRPGKVSYSRFSSVGDRPVPIAKHPKSSRANTEQLFGITFAESTDRDLVCLADSSFLNNQMLTQGYNARFAQNLMLWLGQNGARDSLMLIVDNEVMPPTNAEALVILPPPPTPEQVWDTLGDIQPSFWTLMDFGNDVAHAVEDEGLIDEFAASQIDKMSNRRMNAFRVGILFALSAMTCLVAFLWQKKMLRKTSSDVAANRQESFKRVRKSNQAIERQVAASILLNAFCLDIANRRLEDWSMFPQGIDLGPDPEAMRMLARMSDLHQALKTQPPGYWTVKRLMQLELSTQEWRAFMAARGQMINESGRPQETSNGSTRKSPIDQNRPEVDLSGRSD